MVKYYFFFLLQYAFAVSTTAFQYSSTPTTRIANAANLLENKRHGTPRRQHLLVPPQEQQQQQRSSQRRLPSLLAVEDNSNDDDDDSNSSYEVDTDEDAEQRLGEIFMQERQEGQTTTVPTTTIETTVPTPSTPTESVSSIINGNILQGDEGDNNNNHRFDELLDSVGLKDKLRFPKHLSTKRYVNTNDVFCNRELKLSNVKAIGFDMDYTLVEYQQPAFDKLAFDGAKEKLVYNLGYPEEVLDFEYDHTFWIRGLIIDTQRGNFLKIDRHKYVRVAYHGFDQVSSTTRKHLYSKTFNKMASFSEKSFVNMDTLFQFVDAHLFASLIDLKDKGEYEFLDFKTYEEIYRHVRECVDLCHRDGVIKDEVAKEPHKYIVYNEGAIAMLKRFRDEGIKLFLLTNSYWEYTSTAMNYLYHGKLVDDKTQKKNEWLQLFDVAIVGSCKPAYMLDPYLNLFRVKTNDGSLLNTDGLFEIEALGKDGASKFLSIGKVFQGGNWRHLQAMLEIDAGEEILYVGDHLYADVLRTKRTLGWRSAFIVPELADEIKTFYENKFKARQITQLRQLRDELSLFGEEIRRKHYNRGRENDDDYSNIEKLLNEIEEEDLMIKQKLSTIAASWHAAFHPVWGAMFNAGYQDSRFAFYVQNYACLYTSKATNLGLVSSHRDFRTGLEMLPHDRLLASRTTEFEENDDPWSWASSSSSDEKA